MEVKYNENTILHNHYVYTKLIKNIYLYKIVSHFPRYPPSIESYIVWSTYSKYNGRHNNKISVGVKILRIKIMNIAFKKIYNIQDLLSEPFFVKPKKTNDLICFFLT